MLESLLVCENDVLNILDLIEDTYLDEELNEYDDFTPLLRSIKNTFPRLCEEGSICHTILKTMPDKITEEDAELILEMIDEMYLKETHYMEEMLEEPKKLQHLLKFLESYYPNRINKKSSFYRTIFK